MSALGAITVEPAVFTKVEFDAEQIATLLRDVAARVPGIEGVPGVHVVIDENEPTSRVAIASLDPLTFTIESGALEETKAPRTFGPTQASLTFARLLIEYRDRTDPEFGAPEVPEPLDLATKTSWEVSCVGRATRCGFRAHKPRFRYNYRNRFGFSDAADADFDQIWSNDAPSYADISGRQAR